jgi:DNA-binding response OmpR family regulator
LCAAYDGGHALAAAHEFRPEIVLLGLGLRDMSGHDVARQLSADTRLKDATLAALTGWGSRKTACAAQSPASGTTSSSR